MEVKLIMEEKPPPSYIEGIPKIPPKAVSKFRIPINKPSQSKLKAVLAQRQKLKDNIVPRNAITRSDVPVDNPEIELPLTKESKIAKILEIQRKTAALNEVCNNLRKEEENLRRSNLLIKNEIASLNDVQGNLLWLLKKANQYETQKNHAQ